MRHFPSLCHSLEGAQIDRMAFHQNSEVVLFYLTGRYVVVVGVVGVGGVVVVVVVLLWLL